MVVERVLIVEDEDSLRYVSSGVLGEMGSAVGASSRLGESSDLRMRLPVHEAEAAIPMTPAVTSVDAPTRARAPAVDDLTMPAMTVVGAGRRTQDRARDLLDAVQQTLRVCTTKKCA